MTNSGKSFFVERKTSTSQKDFAKLYSAFQFIKATHGIPYLRQFIEIVMLRYGPAKLGMSEYLLYGLFRRKITTADKKKYASWRRWTELEREMVPPEWWIVFEDKLLFQALLSAFNIAQPESVALIRSGLCPSGILQIKTKDELRKFLQNCRDFPLFCKPVSTGRGEGIAKIVDFDYSRDTLISANGVTTTIDHFFNDTIEYHERGYLLQKVIRQNAQLVDLVGETLATIKFVVFLSRTEAKINQAVWRVPTAGMVTDHFSQGSLVSGVDLATGKIKQVVASAGPNLSIVDSHPQSGRKLSGFRLPDWDNTKKFVISSAAHFPQIRMQAWDIAISESGPIAIEANIAGDQQSPQIANNCGAFDGEAAHLLTK